MALGSDYFKFRSAMFIAAAALMSTIVSCQELKYSIWGKTTDATIDALDELVTTDRYGDESSQLRVKFTYDDDGKTVTMHDRLPMEWDLTQAQATGTISVQYLAGDKYSARVSGHRNMVPVYIFLIMMAIVAGYIIYFIRAAKRPY